MIQGRWRVAACTPLFIVPLSLAAAHRAGATLLFAASLHVARVALTLRHAARASL